MEIKIELDDDENIHIFENDNISPSEYTILMGDTIEINRIPESKMKYLRNQLTGL